MPIYVLETLNSASTFCTVTTQWWSKKLWSALHDVKLIFVINYREPPPNAIEDRYWWEKLVWLVTWRPWSWGYRQFEMEFVSVHFMFNRNSQKVVVRTLHEKALNSSFLFMWEQCLDKEIAPMCDQLALQAGALQGNSHLAGEASWTQLNRLSRMH